MQRVSSIVKNKENANNKKLETKERVILTIGSDVLSRITKNRLPIAAQVLRNTSTSTKDGCMRRHPEIIATGCQIYSINLQDYPFLRKIIIHDSGTIKLDHFDGLTLKELVFENVLKFEISDLIYFKLNTLSLKKMTVSPSMLCKLIKVLAPLEVLVDRVETEATSAFRMLQDVEIRNIASINSFADLNQFLDFVCKKGFKKFHFVKDTTEIKYSSVGQSFSYLVLRNLNLFNRADVINFDWLKVDILSIDSCACVIECIQRAFSKLKFLELSNIKIDNSLVKHLPKLSSVFLRDCSFENTSFYELINTQKDSLRFISFTNVVVPTDGDHFIRAHTIDCKVIFNSNWINRESNTS